MRFIPRLGKSRRASHPLRVFAWPLGPMMPRGAPCEHNLSCSPTGAIGRPCARRRYGRCHLDPLPVHPYWLKPRPAPKSGHILSGRLEEIRGAGWENGPTNEISFFQGLPPGPGHCVGPLMQEAERRTRGGPLPLTKLNRTELKRTEWPLNSLRPLEQQPRLAGSGLIRSDRIASRLGLIVAHHWLGAAETCEVNLGDFSASSCDPGRPFCWSKLQFR